MTNFALYRKNPDGTETKLTRWTGHLYYREESGKLNHISEFGVLAADMDDARRQILDGLWDHRLDSTDCVPWFDWDETGTEVEDDDDGE